MQQPYAPQPVRSNTPFRYVVVAAATLVALAALVLVGVLLYPRAVGVEQAAATPVAATPAPPVSVVASPPTVYVQQPAAPRTVTVPVPASSDSGPGGYSCGTVGEYSIWVNNGNVPCTSAVRVTSQWLSTGTTPGAGAGPAGTPLSWTCSADVSAAGLCTSKMGSTFTINR